MRYIDRNRAPGQRTYRWEVLEERCFVCVSGCESSAVRTEIPAGRGQQGKRRGCGFRIRCCRNADGSYILYNTYIRMVERSSRAEDGMSVRLAVGGISGHRDAGSVCHQQGIWQRLCGIRIRSQPYQGSCMYMARWVGFTRPEVQCHLCMRRRLYNPLIPQRVRWRIPGVDDKLWRFCKSTCKHR